MISTWAASQMDSNVDHSITDKYNPQLHLIYHPTGTTGGQCPVLRMQLPSLPKGLESSDDLVSDVDSGFRLR
jgi:hypothetical protein